MSKEIPDIIKEVGFDFSWDEKKVWQIDAPTESIPISDLLWHLDIPFLWSKPNGFYDIFPRDVLSNPEKYPEEYSRTMRADTTYPIDVMFWKGRWVILDGLHRLMKQAKDNQELIDVRKVPVAVIPLIKT